MPDQVYYPPDRRYSDECMDILTLASVLISVSALFAWVNYKVFKLPTTIGIMLISLAFSVVLVLLSRFGVESGFDYARSFLGNLDFNRTLMEGMLSWLLFAGALHVNLSELLDKKLVVGILASVGVVASTVMIGYAAWYLLGLLGLSIPFIYCLLFGALISPTDPVAVMGVLKSAGATKSLETKIAGESLFNDGVAIVVFLVIYGIAVNGQTPDFMQVSQMFLHEAVGGAIWGLVIGTVVLHMLKQVDNYQVEVLLTLGLVGGGQAVATALHVSGPIAIVVAGLIIGNQGRRDAMSATTRKNLDTFWELLDEILNAVLFLMIGLEVILIDFDFRHVQAGLLFFVIVIVARSIAVGVPVSILKLRREFHPHVVKILTWGGLRGGISVALALSLPAGPERDTIVAITYIIVICSIVIQGLTVQKLVAFAAGKG